MSRPQRVMVLACSSVTTGEFTMTMDVLRRCTRPMELHALVGNGLVTMAKWNGARVHTYPALGAGLAFAKIDGVVRTVRPDVIVVADMLLMFGLSPEFAGQLSMLLPEAMGLAKVVALDLYDFDQTAMKVDIFGRALFKQPPLVPEGLGRLHPCPSLPPARSTPGHGRYATVEDAGARPLSERRQVRQEMGVPPDHALVVVTTSSWQHRLSQHPEGGKVAVHFPELMFRYLSLAAGAARPAFVVHIGAHPFALPAELPGVQYRHVESQPPDAFRRLLGAADVFLNPNCPSSTAMRAASLRVPVATLFAGATRTSAPTPDPAGAALATYLQQVNGGYPFYLWPVGMHAMLDPLLVDNPFTRTQAILDIHDPSGTVSSLAALLRGGSPADEMKHAQEAFFADLVDAVDSPDDALSHALYEG